MSLRFSLAVAVLAFVPYFVGCEDEEMAWTPDSSALVYRDENKGWSRYDLKAKSAEQVLKATTQGSQGIAVSPRGDQLAVGTATARKRQLDLQIATYSRTGESVRQSIKFDIGEFEKEPAPDGLLLEWSTSGRIAVFAATGVGLYDPATDKLLWLKDYAPYQEGIYVGSNLLPDGSGLILEKIDRQASPNQPLTNLPNIVFVDWEGRVVRTTRVPPPPAQLSKLMSSRAAKVCLAEYAVWSGPTCRMQLHDFRLDVNPKTGVAQWFSAPLQLDKHVPGYDPRASYIALPVGAGGVYVYWKTTDQDGSLELMNVKTKSHQVLVPHGDVHGAVRSPDGKKLAVTYVDTSEDKLSRKQTTIIIDETGQTVGTLARGEYQLLHSDDPAQVAPAPEAAPAPAAPAAEDKAPQ